MSYSDYIFEILKKIKESNFRLYLDSKNNLRLDTYQDQLEDQLKEKIALHKDELIRFLKNQSGEREIPEAAHKSHYPLSSAQRRLYFLQEFDRTSVAYNIPQVVKLEGEFDPKRLKEAFVKLIAHHEILRTSFEVIAREIFQKISVEVSFEIEYFESDEVGIPPIINNFIRPFDLGQSPLLRVGLIKQTEQSHILMFDMHHIVSDEVSQGLMIKDFMSLYNDETLPVQRLQYKDYSEWQQSTEQQERLEGHRKFWLNEFSEGVSILNLPTDFPRPLKKSHSGSSIGFSFSKEEMRRLQLLSQETGSTMYMITLSLFNVLLSKLSGQEDIIIGTPTSGRVHADLEGIMGVFVNTLALRNYPKSELRFVEFLDRVREKTLSCFDNQTYQYEELIEELKLARDQARNPLFDVVFSYHNIETEELNIPGLKLASYDNGHEISKFDLLLSAVEGTEQLYLRIEYATELFAEETITKFINYFKNIVTAITSDFKKKIAEIDLLPEQEKNQLINGLDFSLVGFPREKTIIDLFEDQVKRNPNQIAVMFGEEKITYSDLSRRSNSLGYLLREQGAGPDSIVGLLMGHSIDTIVGMLGILKAGGAYLPLDINYPEERISYLLRDSGSAILVTSKKLPVSKDYLIRTVFVEDAIDPIAHLDHINKPSDLCYVIYTSGTTGYPKGVMIEHRNIVRLFFNDKFQFDFGQEDVWTMFHSHCFDFSVWEIYGALLNGGKLVIVSQQDARDPLSYLRLIQRYGVTVLNQTPTAFYNLIDALQSNDIKLSSLRYVIFGGEALMPSKLSAWYDQYSNVKLINMYGITETTVHVTYKEIGENEIRQNVSNIGKPIPTVSIYILDNNKQLVPEGVIGEMYVGGFGLGRGYINNELLTNERFTSNPFKTGEQLYKSGDLARILPTGEIEYKGRSDHQVQLKGYRIELGEIEHHLTQNHFIDQAVVVSGKDDEEHPYLCAYVVGKQSISTEDTRSYLSKIVPPYMIPSFIVQIDKIPFNANNKVDFNKLPKPNVESLNSYSAPRDSTEEIMATIWSKILSVERVGWNDNYFSLGGDSLKAIGLISEINNELHTAYSIADLYSYQTIGDLAQLLKQKQYHDQRTMAQAENDLKAFQEEYIQGGYFQETYEDVFPMNGVEKGMIYHSMKAGKNKDNIHNIIFHEQNIYPIHIQNFDCNLFNRALHLLIEKHGEFRKMYDLDRFVHIIKKQINPDISYIDISHLKPDEQDVFVKQKMHEEKLKMTNLSLSVLWRMSIFRSGPNLHYLLFDMHHSVMDGWSLSSFMTELNNTYFRLKKDPNYHPVSLKCSYRDQILVEMNAFLKEASRQYWKNELLGYERLQFPTTGLAHESKTRVFNLGRELRNELTELALSLNSNFKHICFAAYIYMMKTLSYSSDLTVGIVTNARPLVPDGEELIGCFLNTVPFRANVSGDMNSRDFIVYMEHKLRKLKEHDSIPLNKILELTGEVRSEQNPIFDASFNYIDFRVLKNIIKESKEIDYESDQIDFDTHSYMNNNTLFDFHVRALDHGFEITFAYSTRIISDDLCLRLYSYFNNILRVFLKNEEVLLKDHRDLAVSLIDILSEGEKQQLLYEFNDTAVDYPREKTVMDLFEEQVKKTPDQVAVWFGADKMTYRELQERSDNIAVYLQQSEGVKAGDLVGLLLEREAELLPSIFGILKSGGAYVPLSTGYPPARVASIISDSGLKVLITRGQHIDALGIEMESGLVDLDRAMEAIGEQRCEQLAGKPVGSDLAYVIYTSGSTGKPKGVMVEHHSIVNRLLWMQKEYPLGEDDVLLQKTPLAFDVSVWELFWWSFVGASVCLLAPEEEKEPARLIEAIAKYQVTTVHFVPPMLSAFLEEVASIEDDHLSSVRRVFASGEALSADQVTRFGQTLYRRHATRLINLYGPTEATVDVSYYECDFTHIPASIPIGKPIANTGLYVMGLHNQLCPPGVPGELCIGGVGLARGYMNDAQLTSEKFVANPYLPSERVYRTGDLARWLPDGNIEFMGRIDNQVKIRGYRIELGEIEFHLLSYTNVKQALVKCLKNQDDEKLVAFLVPEPNTTINLFEIKKYLKSKLPGYMIPALIQKIDKIPLTDNGKVDDKTLLKSIGNSSSRKSTGTTSITDVEKYIIKVWTELLSVDEISADDNFFDLGGHSLLLIKANRLVAKKYSIELPFNLYFINTLEQIAQEIENQIKMNLAIETIEPELQ
jgi:amino acid adenylation domain-containing protein